eukprot:UN00295
MSAGAYRRRASVSSRLTTGRSCSCRTLHPASWAVGPPIVTQPTTGHLQCTAGHILADSRRTVAHPIWRATAMLTPVGPHSWHVRRNCPRPSVLPMPPVWSSTTCGRVTRMRRAVCCRAPWRPSMPRRTPLRRRRTWLSQISKLPQRNASVP